MAFEEQQKASTEQAKEWGKRVGLTSAQMENCLNSADILAKIKDDADLATKIGVNATPSIFINGREFRGSRTLNEIQAAIESLE